MINRKLLSTMIVGAMAFGLSSTAVLAQENQADQSMQPTNKMQQHDMKSMHKGQQRMHRMGMQGRHMMPATVTSVDKTTGKMSVNAGGMDLNVHFPPKSLTDVNKGDKITLMLGFRKGDMKAMQKDHMMKNKSMKDTKSIGNDAMDHDKDDNSGQY